MLRGTRLGFSGSMASPQVMADMKEAVARKHSEVVRLDSANSTVYPPLTRSTCRNRLSNRFSGLARAKLTESVSHMQQLADLVFLLAAITTVEQGVGWTKLGGNVLRQSLAGCGGAGPSFEVLGLMEKMAGGDGSQGWTSTLWLLRARARELEESGTTRFLFEQGKRYLLRIVNGAMLNGHFFAIAIHMLTAVGRDGSYLKPFERDFVIITPGQTMDVMVQANQPEGLYYMVVSPYIAATEANSGFLDTTVTTAIVEYQGFNATSNASVPFPYVPSVTDTQPAYEFAVQEKSLASDDHPIDVPMEIDSRFIITVSKGLLH
ncbi:hypothetical protein EJ110_NYTH14369 [Nymphaea thermarum]|nr:hypothetical protein EJ110_NYTH14369 [Nymphaea thermarum]